MHAIICCHYQTQSYLKPIMFILKLYIIICIIVCIILNNYNQDAWNPKFVKNINLSYIFIYFKIK